MALLSSVKVYPKRITLKTDSWYYGAWAELYPAHADCREVGWYSDNTDVATVDELRGHICAREAGTARIYAQAADGSGIRDFLTVTVISK